MTDSYDVQLGKRLQSIREAKALMQSEVAARMQAAGINWSQTIYSKVERGDRPLRIEEAEALVGVLSLESVDELIGAGAPYAGPLSAVNHRSAMQEEALTEAANQYLDLLSKASMLKMLNALWANPEAKWSVNCSSRDLFYALQRAASGAGIALILEDLNADPSEMASATLEAHEMFGRWQRNPQDVSGWGDLVGRVPAQHDTSDDSHIRVLEAASDATHWKLFRRMFPNIATDVPLGFPPGSKPKLALEIITVNIPLVEKKPHEFYEIACPVEGP